VLTTILAFLRITLPYIWRFFKDLAYIFIVFFFEFSCVVLFFVVVVVFVVAFQQIPICFERVKHEVNMDDIMLGTSLI